jgi:hypothetical protein
MERKKHGLDKNNKKGVHRMLRGRRAVLGEKILR